MGWARDHLGPARRAQVARELFRVTREERGELVGICPLHDDRNASLSYNPGKDLWHCFGCGPDSGGDLVDLFAQVHGLDKSEGLRRFRQTYAPGEATTTPPKRDRPTQGESDDSAAKLVPPEDWESLELLPEYWLDRLERERGWSRAVMASLGLRLWRKGGTERIAIPVRDSQGRLVNVRLYQPGASEGKVRSWGRGLGTVRLLPGGELPPEEPLWLVEGEPDWLCALSHGLNAVCSTGGAGTFKPHWVARFRGRRVVICFDADQAGREGAAKAARELADHAASVRVLTWPQDVPQHFDLTDWFVKRGGSRAELEELLPSEPGPAQAQDQDDDECEAPESELDDGNLQRFWAKSSGDNKYAYRARLLVEELLAENKILTDRETSLSYRWNGKVWRPVLEEELKGLAYGKLGILASRNRASEAAEMIRGLTMLPEGERMNTAPELLCCANGLVNLNSGDVYPHDPAYRHTFMFPWSFDPRYPQDYPTFRAYLASLELDRDQLRELREFAGYCLWPRNQFKKCMFLVGRKDSGKSLFLDLLQLLVGEDNCANINLGDLQDQFLRVTLHGKALNVFPEAHVKFFEGEMFKAIVAGDRITAAYKHLPAFQFRPTCKMLFSMNSFPRVAGADEAFYDRIVPVRFERVFKPHEQDTQLLAKLREELPGIFGWAVAGLYDLRRRGWFKLSQASKKELGRLQMETNPVMVFADERLTSQPEDAGLSLSEPPEVRQNAVYAAYASWCKESGYKAMSKSVFFRVLREVLPDVKYHRLSDKRGGRFWIMEGVRLVSTQEGIA